MVVLSFVFPTIDNTVNKIKQKVQMGDTAVQSMPEVGDGHSINRKVNSKG